jgi:hypothetical protein
MRRRCNPAATASRDRPRPRPPPPDPPRPGRIDREDVPYPQAERQRLAHRLPQRRRQAIRRQRLVVPARGKDAFIGEDGQGRLPPRLIEGRQRSTIGAQQGVVDGRGRAEPRGDRVGGTQQQRVAGLDMAAAARRRWGHGRAQLGGQHAQRRRRVLADWKPAQQGEAAPVGQAAAQLVHQRVQAGRRPPGHAKPRRASRLQLGGMLGTEGDHLLARWQIGRRPDDLAGQGHQAARGDVQGVTHPRQTSLPDPAAPKHRACTSPPALKRAGCGATPERSIPWTP